MSSAKQLIESTSYVLGTQAAKNVGAAFTRLKSVKAALISAKQGQDGLDPLDFDKLNADLNEMQSYLEEIIRSAGYTVPY